MSCYLSFHSRSLGPQRLARVSVLIKCVLETSICTPVRREPRICVYLHCNSIGVLRASSAYLPLLNSERHFLFRSHSPSPIFLESEFTKWDLTQNVYHSWAMKRAQNLEQDKVTLLETLLSDPFFFGFQLLILMFFEV